MALDNADTALLNRLNLIATSIASWQTTINAPNYDYTQLMPILDAAFRSLTVSLDSYRADKNFTVAAAATQGKIV